MALPQGVFTIISNDNPKPCYTARIPSGAGIRQGGPIKV